MDEGMTAIVEELALPAGDKQQPDTAQPIENDDAPEFIETDGDGSEAEGDEGAEGVTAAAPEMAEIEINGKKYQIPVELKDGYLMQSDYTRKTQEVAEIRRAAESQREQAAALFQSSEEFIKANAFKLNVEQQLQQYQNANWEQMEQEDPMGAQSHWRKFQQLKEQRGQVAQYLDKTQSERNANAERDIATRLHETRQFAEKEIPGWTPEVDLNVSKFAQGVGFTPDQLKAAMNPQIYRVLHLAMLGEQAMQKQKSAPPRPQAPTKPLTTITPKATAPGRKSVAEMSVDDMAAYLNKR